MFRKLAERRSDDAFALRIADRIVRRGRRRERVELVGCFGPRALARVTRDVARDPTQPRRQTIRIAQLAEPSPRGDERILRDVIRERSITGCRERHRIHRALVPLDQRGEGGAIAPSARLDQVTVCAGLHVPL